QPDRIEHVGSALRTNRTPWGPAGPQSGPYTSSKGQAGKPDLPPLSIECRRRGGVIAHSHLHDRAVAAAPGGGGVRLLRRRGQPRPADAGLAELPGPDAPAHPHAPRGADRLSAALARAAAVLADPDQGLGPAGALRGRA